MEVPDIKVHHLKEAVEAGGLLTEMTFNLMLKFSGKHEDELEEEMFTEENILLFNLITDQAVATGGVQEGDHPGEHVVTLAYPIKSTVRNKTWKKVVIHPLKVGTLLRNPLLPTNNPDLDQLNWQLVILERLTELQAEEILDMAYGDFQAIGTVLGNLEPFRSLNTLPARI